MRIVSLKRVFLDLLGNKKLIIIVIAACMVLGTLNSVRTLGGKVSEADAAAAEYQKKLDEYNAALETLDESVNAQKENLEVVKQQFKDVSDYCENSIYMRLDANAIYMGEVQLACVGEVDTGRVMNALMTYYDSVEMRKSIGESIGVKEEYLKEVMFYTSASNTLRFYFYFDTEGGANELMDCILTELDKAKPQISEAQGGYTLTQQSREIGLRADSGIQNGQNTWRNNYKNYNNSVADTEKSINDKQVNRDKYAQDNLPEPAYPMGAKDKVLHIVKGLIFGAIVGVAGLIVFGVCRILFGTRIRDEECLRGIGVYPLLTDGKDEKSLSVIAGDLELCCRKNQKSSLVLMGISEMDAEITGKLTSLLAGKGITVEGLVYDPTDPGLTVSLGQGTPLVLYVRKGVSKYRDLNDACDRLSRYDTEVVGGIFNTTAPKKSK